MEALGVGPIAVTSPEGRFAEGAALLDGRRLRSVEATGKHLFYAWDARPILHVHLGMDGRFRTDRAQPPRPPPNARLALMGDAAVYLRNPATCALLDPAQAAAMRSRLGPDPLNPDADPERFFAALDRHEAPIGAVLLDQRVIAGIGNVYRSELLYLAGVHPDRVANSLTRHERADLWDRAVELLGLGMRLGRIVTVRPREVGVARAEDIPQRARQYVYRRTHQPCRRCRAEIRSWRLDDRTVYACPTCQSATSASG